MVHGTILKCEHAKPSKDIFCGKMMKCEHAKPTRDVVHGKTLTCEHTKPSKDVFCGMMKCEHTKPSKDVVHGLMMKCEHAKPSKDVVHGKMSNSPSILQNSIASLSLIPEHQIKTAPTNTLPSSLHKHTIVFNKTPPPKMPPKRSEKTAHQAHNSTSFPFRRDYQRGP